jgi:hypothetical protein
MTLRVSRPLEVVKPTEEMLGALGGSELLGQLYKLVAALF